MPKLRSALGAGFLTVSALALAFAPAAYADGAIHIDNAGCGLSDGNGSFAFTTAEKAVITPSGNGNLVCKVDVAPPSSGQAVTFDFDSTGGGLCGTFSGITDKWHETVSADGKATLTCHSGT